MWDFAEKDRDPLIPKNLSKKQQLKHPLRCKTRTYGFG